MVSNAKRMRYVSENEMSTSEEDSDYSQNEQNELKTNRTQRPGRKPKCYSKNALMARENRLKKKLYITNLENEVSDLKSENKKLNRVVDNQSFLIADLKKEVTYLKSVITNSSDISKLIRNIHQSTGMSVTSSLGKTLSLKNDYVPKPKVQIARKTAHPWEENELQYPSYPTPESQAFSSPNSEHGIDEISAFSENLPFDFPLDLVEEDLLKELDLDEVNADKSSSLALQEHNYTSSKLLEENSDVGVCLHVSKHRVSLEFCTSCSENACQAWKN